MSEYQCRPPKAGEEIAILNTSKGTVKLRLFRDEAPKAVENFTTHAKNGYYDGLIFHRVIRDFMIQGGDPLGTGTGGESIWGEPFADEFDPMLHNYKGALSMANAGPHTNGSQFFIVHASSVPANMLSQMKTLGDGAGFSEPVIDAYETLGGTPWLDFKHTVFGQVYEGMDIINAIADCEVGQNDRPKEPITITSIEIATA